MTEEAQPIEAQEPTPEDIAFVERQRFLSCNYGIGIGLSGPHRTGKTTLAQELADKNGIPFVRTSSRAVAERYGFDVNNPGSLQDRVGFQETLLCVFEEDYSKHNCLFISDRTPLDMAAYMLADVQAGEIDSVLDQRIASYVNRCMEMADRHFGMIVGIQPGIPFIAAEGTPSQNMAYQELLNNIIIGLGKVRYKREFYVLDRSAVDFDARKAIVASLASRFLGSYMTQVGTLPRQ